MQYGIVAHAVHRKAQIRGEHLVEKPAQMHGNHCRRSVPQDQSMNPLPPSNNTFTTVSPSGDLRARAPRGKEMCTTNTLLLVGVNQSPGANGKSMWRVIGSKVFEQESGHGGSVRVSSELIGAVEHD